jgi:hypothetical protein
VRMLFLFCFFSHIIYIIRRGVGRSASYRILSNERTSASSFRMP